MCERYWPLYITVISVILWFYICIYVYSFNFSHDKSNTPNQEMTCRRYLSQFSKERNRCCHILSCDIVCFCFAQCKCILCIMVLRKQCIQMAKSEVLCCLWNVQMSLFKYLTSLLLSTKTLFCSPPSPTPEI